MVPQRSSLSFPGDIIDSRVRPSLTLVASPVVPPLGLRSVRSLWSHRPHTLTQASHLTEIWSSDGCFQSPRPEHRANKRNQDQSVKEITSEYSNPVTLSSSTQQSMHSLLFVALGLAFADKSGLLRSRARIPEFKGC